MRITLVASRDMDPRRPDSFAGIPYFMLRALRAAGADVTTCMLRDPFPARLMFRHAYWRWVKQRRYLRFCETRILRHYAVQIERTIRACKPDVVLCPRSHPISHLRSAVPAIFWSDACFASLVNFYDSHSNLADCSTAGGHGAEYEALRNSARAVYSSEWAATRARESYSASVAKVRVVPFGTNLIERPSLLEVWKRVADRDTARCNLLLIGTDWRRKGADIAIEAVHSLHERGQAAALTIVGCAPPRGTDLPSWVEVVPRIDKSTPHGHRRFGEICWRSHFLVMPSRADCTPLAIAEANCFGLPCLAAEVGGIPSLVANGSNGRLVHPRAGGIAYADHILGLVRDRGEYRSLAVRSAERAAREFSWECSAVKLLEIVREVAEARSAEAPGEPLAA